MTLQLLQADVDEEDESYLRFLSEGKFVKYVTITGGLYSTDDLCFGPVLIPMLPAFPPGDWNVGCIAPDPATGKPHFSEYSRKQLPGVESLWHPTQVDHLEVSYDSKLRTGVYGATHPRFESTFVVKFARFDWEMEGIRKECLAYQWVEGEGIGPKFLGYLTEEGRAIGFLMERITNARPATPDDFEPCHEVLSKLHSLGIVHGDTNKHNFLIADGRAVLIDFGVARKERDRSALREELEGLPGQLASTSSRGGIWQATDSGSSE